MCEGNEQIQKKTQSQAFVHDLMRERREKQKADMSFMPEELRADKAKEKKITTPVLGLSEMVRRVKDKDYDKEGLKKWKISQSKEMKAITEGADSLSGLLDKEIDAGKVDQEYKEIKDKYDQVIKACAKYLSDKHPRTAEGKARYALVERLSERLYNEIRTMDFNIETVKKQGKVKGKWSAVISEAQRQTLIDGKDGVEYLSSKELASQSSDLKVINDNGKKIFFKEDEIILPIDSKQIVAHLTEKYTKEKQQLLLGEKGAYAHLSAKEREEKLIYFARMVKVVNKFAPVFRNLEIAKAEFASESAIFRENKELVEGLAKEDIEAFRSIYSDFKKLSVKAVASDIARIDPGTEVTKRNEATSIMADLLGISDMMMVSKRARLNIDGRDVEGLRMDEVKGADLSDTLCTEKALDKTVHLSPKAMKQMMTMQVFDLICGQMDRNLSNYLIQSTYDEKTAKVTIDSVCGIDNDYSFGKLTYNDILHNATRRPGAVQTRIKNIEKIKNGKTTISLIALDESFADRILALTPAMIDAGLGGLLSKDEISACKDRLKGVQQAIMKIKKQDKEALKKDPKAETIIKKNDNDWKDLREKLEKSDYNYKRDVMGDSYLQPETLGKKMEEFFDYNEWKDYRRKGKEEYSEKVSMLKQMYDKKDFAGMKKLIPGMRGPWMRSDHVPRESQDKFEEIMKTEDWDKMQELFPVLEAYFIKEKITVKQ